MQCDRRMLMVGLSFLTLSRWLTTDYRRFMIIPMLCGSVFVILVVWFWRWSVGMKDDISTVRPPEAPAVEVAWPRAGDRVAAVHLDRVRVWRYPDLDLILTYRNGENPLCMAWSPDGERFASGTEAG